MRDAWLVFPHTLFEAVVEGAVGMEIRRGKPALFLTQFPFHRQKLFLHRVSMARFAERPGARHRRIVDCPTLDAALAVQNDVPIAALEGFVRQLVGWRELMRIAYLTIGRRQRTGNALGHSNPLPEGFWDGTTGLAAVDAVAKRVLRTGYAHHSERLMVLSGAMLMLEVHPNEVYRWFMSLFVDAYDWVMVPNVYGIGQFADGGLMSTKPYFAASAYLRRMGD